MSPTTAIATDLWFAAITKLVGARVHHTNGNVDWQVAKRLWLGSLPMALLIVVVVSLGAQVDKGNWRRGADHCNRLAYCPKVGDVCPRPTDGDA